MQRFLPEANFGTFCPRLAEIFPVSTSNSLFAMGYSLFATEQGILVQIAGGYGFFRSTRTAIRQKIRISLQISLFQRGEATASASGGFECRRGKRGLAHP
jgi:hypothetical protein